MTNDEMLHDIDKTIDEIVHKFRTDYPQDYIIMRDLPGFEDCIVKLYYDKQMLIDSRDIQKVIQKQTMQLCESLIKFDNLESEDTRNLYNEIIKFNKSEQVDEKELTITMDRVGLGKLTKFSIGETMTSISKFIKRNISVDAYS